MFLASLQPHHWVIIGVAIFLAANLIFAIWFTFETARRVYLHTLSTKMSTKWGRECSAPDNPIQMKMWEDGLSYMKQFEDKKEEMEITNGGLKLKGEFFDFGKKKTVLFLCGRNECALYAYFYAKPYVESGYNLLFIDPRAHGLSEGELSTVGIKESDDAIAWMKHVREFKGQEKFLLHCICVGTSTGLLAVNSPKNDGLVEKIVLDGVYTTFKESYKRHYVDLGHKTFPVYYQIWFWFKVYTGVSVKLSAPIDLVKNLDLPVLFLHSKNDKFSLPEKATEVFNATKSEKKTFVWFDKGYHSHIRDHETEKYDQSIKDFLTDN